MSWGAKFFISILIDIFDFTIGRFLFAIPFSGEIMGTLASMTMFGPRALLYLLESVDPTEQIDGFIPAATFIALAAKKDHP